MSVYVLRVKIGANEFTYEGPVDPTTSSAYFDFRSAVMSSGRIEELQSELRTAKANLDHLMFRVVQLEARPSAAVQSPANLQASTEGAQGGEDVGLASTDSKVSPDSTKEGEGE